MTIFFLRFFGVLYLVAGLAMWQNAHFFHKALHEVRHNIGTRLNWAMLPLILGTIMIVLHSVWEGEFRIILVSIIGWLAFLKGIVLLAFPRVLTPIMKYIDQEKHIRQYAPIVIVLGLILGYFGYYM